MNRSDDIMLLLNPKIWKFKLINYVFLFDSCLPSNWKILLEVNKNKNNRFLKLLSSINSAIIKRKNRKPKELQIIMESLN